MGLNFNIDNEDIESGELIETHNINVLFELLKEKYMEQP